MFFNCVTFFFFEEHYRGRYPFSVISTKVISVPSFIGTIGNPRTLTVSRQPMVPLVPMLPSESARYSIHLRESITWSACGNGQKKNEKKKKEKE